MAREYVWLWGLFDCVPDTDSLCPEKSQIYKAKTQESTVRIQIWEWSLFTWELNPKLGIRSNSKCVKCISATPGKGGQGKHITSWV